MKLARLKLAIRMKLWKWLQVMPADDYVVGGSCGCCGAHMKENVFPKGWRWGLCDKCAKK